MTIVFLFLSENLLNIMSLYDIKPLLPIYIISFFLASVGFAAPAGAQSTGYPDLDLYYSQMEKNYNDKLSTRIHHLMDITPIDTLLTAYIDRGFDVLRDGISLFHYFDPDDTILTPGQRRAFVCTLDSAARKYNNPRLNRLIDFFRARSISTVYYDLRIKELEQVVRKCRKANDRYLEAFTLKEMWFDSYYGQQFAHSFAYGQRYEGALDRVDNNYPNKGAGYIELGISYYNFKDYKRALLLLHKGLLYQKESVKAWNYIAIYHQMNGNLDSAAYYNRAIIASEDALRNLPAHLAIAISNLGRLELTNGNYDAAIAMLQAGLDFMRKEKHELSFVIGIYTSLGEAWLDKGDLPMARKYIDSVYYKRPELDNIYWQNRATDLFMLESRYYAHLGQHDLSKAHLDSALVATRNNLELTGKHIVRLGEQQLQQIEIDLKSQEVVRQRNLIIFIFVILTIVSGAMIIILRLYRKKSAAYKSLAHRAKEWARKDMSTIAAPPASKTKGYKRKEPATEEDRRIMALVECEMNEKFAYRDAGLSVESLADRLGIHRNTLSHAVNHATGGNFSQYINSLRIKEAIRIISGTEHNELYIDELYEKIGFGNRSSFYRVFKQFTGLSPTEFQKNSVGAVNRG